MKGIAFLEDEQPRLVWPSEDKFEQVLKLFANKNPKVVTSEEAEEWLAQYQPKKELPVQED